MRMPPLESVVPLIMVDRVLCSWPVLAAASCQVLAQWRRANHDPAACIAFMVLADTVPRYARTYVHAVFTRPRPAVAATCFSFCRSHLRRAVPVCVAMCCGAGVAASSQIL